jgi:hypothetical protein
MKMIPRWVLGLVSSLCFALNWNRAAAALDPSTRGRTASDASPDRMASPPPCTSPCALLEGASA